MAGSALNEEVCFSITYNGLTLPIFAPHWCTVQELKTAVIDEYFPAMRVTLETPEAHVMLGSIKDATCSDFSDGVVGCRTLRLRFREHTGKIGGNWPTFLDSTGSTQSQCTTFDDALTGYKTNGQYCQTSSTELNDGPHVLLASPLLFQTEAETPAPPAPENPVNCMDSLWESDMWESQALPAWQSLKCDWDYKPETVDWFETGPKNNADPGFATVKHENTELTVEQQTWDLAGDYASESEPPELVSASSEDEDASVEDEEESNDSITVLDESSFCADDGLLVLDEEDELSRRLLSEQILLESDLLESANLADQIRACEERLQRLRKKEQTHDDVLVERKARVGQLEADIQTAASEMLVAKWEEQVQFAQDHLDMARALLHNTKP